MNALVTLSAAALIAASSPGAAPAASRPASAPSAAHAALPWIEDDYARAIAEGKRRGLPVFVEAWAPW